MRSMTYYVPLPAPIGLPKKASELEAYSPSKLQFPKFDVYVEFEGAYWVIRLDVEQSSIGPLFRVRLILSETLQPSLKVAAEVQLSVVAAPYAPGRDAACSMITHPLLITDDFSATNPSTASFKISYLKDVYPRGEEVLTYHHTYLIFRMFRIYGDKKQPSLPSSTLPSSMLTQRGEFGLVGMYNYGGTSCFMNVVFGVIASIRSLADEILKVKNPNEHLQRFQLVIHDLVTRNDPCTIQGRLQPLLQSDAHQFYNIIFKRFEENAEISEKNKVFDLTIGTPSPSQACPLGSPSERGQKTLGRSPFPLELELPP